jgi:hypothetical protein
MLVGRNKAVNRFRLVSDRSEHKQGIELQKAVMLGGYNVHDAGKIVFPEEASSRTNAPTAR